MSKAAPPLGVLGMLRWAWRLLTSMRTALVLLFLLALAAIPGSMLPQLPISPIEVAQYQRNNPELNAWFEPLGFYDVYASGWFSAIYLLLFISLVGCILPRIAHYARSLTAPAPAIPKRPQRLTGGSVVEVEDPEAALAAAERWLQQRRYRVSRSEAGISAERGRIREAGNLVFHTALVVMLVGLAWSNLLGFNGSVVVVEGQSFSNSITQYDDFTAGAWLDTDSLEKFTLDVEKLDAEFETSDVQRGAARRFDLTVKLHQGESSREELVQVNSPLLTASGTQINLLGHGYAPRVTVTDGNGDVAFSGPVIFLPQDVNFTSVGVIKIPDARPDRLAFEGWFLPTAVNQSAGPSSAFPDALNPVLILNAWGGDPKKETGIPENVYELDPTGMAMVPGDDGERLQLILAPGGGMELPLELGTVTFDGYSRWVKLQVSQTPGNALTLTTLLLGVLGLVVSLTVRPRRVFVRVDGQQVALGGQDLAHASAGLSEQMTALSRELATVTGHNQAEWSSGDGGDT